MAWRIRTLLIGAVVLVAACSVAATPAPSKPFWLTIANFDGPPLDIEINGQIVGHSRCSLDPAPVNPAFTPGPGLELPWSVRVLRENGAVLGTWEERGDTGPRTILVRGYQAGEGPSELTSGGPVPSGTCPP